MKQKLCIKITIILLLFQFLIISSCIQKETTDEYKQKRKYRTNSKSKNISAKTTRKSVKTTKKDEYKKLVNRGMYLHKINKQEEAITILNKAIKMKPKQPFAYNNRGLAYFSLNKTDKAIADYDKAIELSSKKNYSIFINKGNALSRQKKYKEALESYKIALENDDGQYGFITRGNISRTLMYMGKYDEALKEIELAQSNPDPSLNNRANGIKGMILYHKGDYKEAINWLNNSDKNLGEIQYYLGMCYEKFDKNKTAMEHYKRALKYSEDVPILEEMRENVTKRIKLLNGKNK